MATYLPNLTDTIPDLPLYQPNFGFFQQMMQRKAAMYEQGFSQVKSAYDSILNAPLNAQGNAELRDNYIKQAQEKLKNLSSVDLSLHQNVEAANSVFAPFWQDDDLLMDYAKSRKINDQLQKAYSLKDSTDPKERQQFWQTGVDYVNVSLRELKMSKRGDGSIGKVQVNEYVPYFDTQGFLDSKAKEQGLTIKRSTTGNGYIIERINGDSTVPLYEEWAARQLANNPQAMDAFRVEGVVDFKSKAFHIMDTAGVDYTTAKSILADDYIKGQKAHYTRYYDDISKKAADLDAELRGKQQDFDKRPGSVTPAELAEFDQKKKQYDALVQSRDYYQQQRDLFSDPDSEQYQKQRNEIITNGESFFAENRRDNFIKNFARIRALNSSVNLSADPVAKMNAELAQDMAKMRQDWQIHVDDMRLKEREMSMRTDGTWSSSSSNGNGSSSGSNSSKGENLNTPLPMGLNVKGEDKISAYNRLLGNKRRFQDQFINSGLSVILAAGTADKIYTDYLDQVMRTGKYTPTEELKNAHRKLQEKGIIPTNYKLGTSPTDVYNRIYDVSEKLMTSKGPDPSTLNLMMNRQDAAIKYGKLKDYEKAATEQIKKDPELSAIYSNEDQQISKNAYLKKIFGTSNFGEYLDKQGPPTGAAGIGSSSSIGYIETWRNAEKRYDELVAKSKEKLGSILNNYINEEGAFIAPVVSLRTDGTGPEERAQTIAAQVMNDNNLRNQIISQNGVLPVNIDQLKSVGADEKEVANIIQNIKGNPGGVIDQVLLSPIGSNGRASVKLMVNRKKLEELLGKDGKISNETLSAIGDGLELDVTTQLTSIPEFETEFISTGIDNMILDKQGSVTAPQFIKSMGMDYNITVDNYSQRYIINLKYPEVINGVQVTKDEPMYVPINTSISDLQRTLTSRLAQIYKVNKELLEKNYTLGSTAANGAVPQNDLWNQYKQSNNIR